MAPSRAGELLKSAREEILRIAAKHGARNVRVFGSMARGDAGENSDVDFLIDLEVDRSLLRHRRPPGGLTGTLGSECGRGH